MKKYNVILRERERETRIAAYESIQRQAVPCIRLSGW